MTTEPNFELIHNLAASNADQAAESITLEVRRMGRRFGWTIEEEMAVGALVCDQRKIAVESALETARIALSEMLGA